MKRNAPPGLAVTARAFFCLLCLALPALGPSRAAAAGERLVVIASLFPQYDFARRIAGDRADVSPLLPPGAESHSYEPTPADMKKIAKADLFIYTGDAMEPWISRLADAAGNANLVDASRGIEPMEGVDPHDHGDGRGHDHDDDEDEDDHPRRALDPHIWLDPLHAMTMADAIAAALAERDPAGADVYGRNAAALKNEIADLDAAFRRTVAAAKTRTLVFGDRFAFAYFFARYGLEEVGPYKSCAPGAEPGLRAVIETIEYIKANRTPVVYRETLSRGRMAETLAEETGVEILPVDSLHNPAADRLAAGYGYVDGMRANMDAFARGLE